MAKKENKVYARYTLKALELMAKQIRTTRIERGITTQDLADRADISRGLLRRIEGADPACSIGVVFEVASILGIPLFHADYNQLAIENKIIDDKLLLLPSEVRRRKIAVDDAF